MTAVSHGWSSPIAATHMRITPAATRRAETSLTGFGKLNSRLAVSVMVSFQEKTD
ncbi:MAG: hypothetical protein QOG44_746 [Acidimicrobiaceae bacterium]|nr:hypothetical protein [Acidimicrobiaceae bacterium]